MFIIWWLQSPTFPDNRKCRLPHPHSWLSKECLEVPFLRHFHQLTLLWIAATQDFAVHLEPSVLWSPYNSNHRNKLNINPDLNLPSYWECWAKLNWMLEENQNLPDTVPPSNCSWEPQAQPEPWGLSTSLQPNPHSRRFPSLSAE